VDYVRGMKLALAVLLFATPLAAEGQPTWEWVDAQCSVVLTTWDDEFRPPMPDGSRDACWLSDDETVECVSGATHEVRGIDQNTIVWDGVVASRKGEDDCE
jgi:hypothetical protein